MNELTEQELQALIRAAEMDIKCEEPHETAWQRHFLRAVTSPQSQLREEREKQRWIPTHRKNNGIEVQVLYDNVRLISHHSVAPPYVVYRDEAGQVFCCDKRDFAHLAPLPAAPENEE